MYSIRGEKSLLFAENFRKAGLLQRKKAAGAITSPANFMRIEEYNLCSVYRQHGKRISYHEILKAPTADLHRSILKIVPRIKLAAPRIDARMDATEGRPAFPKPT